ncbi:protein expanded [Harmonia axyridis]|uniref:protein expanded n=1 Tax=Harmonia axyridis TaxID=115357 RepID=UPI001E27714A|nr:protein expanded [Harmonia axyridis]XP_045473115.1 protein expanded [Harmonia axyridis]XP_045473116.1 protein expanded [Harmonia axyridis]
MRAGLCTVSAPLAACSPAAALPPSARFLALHLLHQQTLYFIVQAKSRVRELYQQTCLHFAQQGMLDTDLYGLALICDGEYLFAEPDSKLSKYAPKSWRSSHSHGLDANGRPALAFYFRVQFYVDSPLLLRDDITRHHYYLQLRLNAASGAAGDKANQLAGLALQADFGDNHESLCFRPEDYLPPNMRGPAALRAIETTHRSHTGLSKAEARTKFIAEACQLMEPVNAHVFRLKASKVETAPGSILLAVCARGLRVCPDNNPPSIFLWSSIGKLSFERKKFEIRTGHEKLTLYTSSDEKSRLLLALCKATHQFSMAVAPRLNEAKKEEEERQRWVGDQRISVISSTSSNTTSGIVSDRVHSEDELEIMITSPPAQSMESLALAHLLDSAPASSRTSAASASVAFASLALKEEEEDDVSKPPCSESSTKTTSGKCPGSQCSSSCSTVVVTPKQTKSKIGRRLSTSSSLELGYSHTAQNSVLSDATCIELDTREVVYTSGPAPSSHTSGVYTLSSSEQYSTQGDQIDGMFRDRSNSNVSNSGSFHGDGSDPTDKQQSLLSAEELSDLIVGKGKYPSCKNVSNTLDSDSDYVTLPSSYKSYLPVPPVRIDSVESRFRPPPPPYPAQLNKLSVESSSVDFSDSSCRLNLTLRHPPPYPENTMPVPPPVYPASSEANARLITTRSPSILTAQTSTVGCNSAPSYSQPSAIVPPIPPKVPRSASQMNAIISPNNYLDVAASKANVLVPCTYLPPPPPAPRHPPPPPPSGVTTVYTSQLSRSQIEQYQQQMYSDVDFVVFPLKEPAISKQEYLEAKQGSILAALAQNQPMFYRSTPYLCTYSSSQNLSDTYVQLPVYGAPSISSTGSLDPPPPPLPPNRPNRFMRTQSDDNILNSLDNQPPKFRRLPPPPPPAPDKREGRLDISKNISERKCDVSSVVATEKPTALDIRTLREKSKKMDLPLISALCNDRSLIKQTKAFVMPKHPGDSVPRQSIYSSTTRQKYPVSGLSSSKINKTARKAPMVSHRHPGDKLPEIPRATPNNYVLTDPRAKHKTMQSHS